MKILYVSDCFTPHDLRFIHAIRRQKHDVWYASYKPGALLPPSNLEIPLWPGDVTDPATFPLDARSAAIDVVHVGPLRGFCASPLENADCAIVAASWAFDVLLSEDAPQYRDSTRRILRRADSLIADCQSVVEKVRELVPEFSAPIVKFPWGISVDRFKEIPADSAEILRDRLGWKDNTILISTRTWDKVYGIENLLDAFSIAYRTNPNLRLLLIGSGPLAQRVHSQIDSLGLRGVIETPGSLPENELPTWFTAADIYVSAALCDGTSISLLEAMACSKPVIAHHRFGNLEWVAPGENGWLCDCSEAETLADCLLRACDEQKKWKAMGAAGRARVFLNANWDVHQFQITKAYEAAIAYRNSGIKHGVQISVGRQ